MSESESKKIDPPVDYKAPLPVAMATQFLLGFYAILGCVSFLANGASVMCQEDSLANLEAVMNILANFSDIFQSIVLIPVLISYALWIRRTFRNLKAFGVPDLKYNGKICLLSPVIPLVHLYLPFAIMNQTWKASNPEITDSGDWRESPALKPLLVFAAIFNISFFSKVICLLLLGSNEEALTLAEYTGVFLELISAILAIIVIAKISSRQELKRERSGIPT